MSPRAFIAAHPRLFVGVAWFLATVAGFLACRCLYPRVEIETKEVVRTVTVEKVRTVEVVRHEKDTHVVTKTVTHTTPAGETTVTKETTADTHAHTDSNATTQKDASADTQSENYTKQAAVRPPAWQVTGLAGMDIHTVSPVYGIHVSRRVLGPIVVGVWGLTNGTAGLSAGVTF